MDLGALLDTCNLHDKWQFSADLFQSNVWPNSAPLRNIRLRNLSDPDFGLSMSLKVKCDVFGLPIYAFLLMLTVTHGLTLLRYKIKGVVNLIDLEFDLSRSLNGKYDVIGLSIYASH